MGDQIKGNEIGEHVASMKLTRNAGNIVIQIHEGKILLARPRCR